MVDHVAQSRGVPSVDENHSDTHCSIARTRIEYSVMQSDGSSCFDMACRDERSFLDLRYVKANLPWDLYYEDF